MATGYNGDISLVPQFLRGYRGWLLSRYNDSEYQLRAVTHRRYVWAPGQQVAECAKSVDHGKTPEPTCECGFYASYTSSGYDEHVAGYPSPHNNWLSPTSLVLIHGAIRATGRVVMGTRGFRAEKAEPEAFCLAPIGGNVDLLPGAAAVLAEEILKPFDVPLFSRMEDLEDAFPASDVSELIPTSEPGRVEPPPADWRGTYPKIGLSHWSYFNSNQVSEIHGVNCHPDRCSGCRDELVRQIQEEYERRDVSRKLMEKHIIYLGNDPRRDAKGRWVL